MGCTVFILTWPDGERSERSKDTLVRWAEANLQPGTWKIAADSCC